MSAVASEKCPGCGSDSARGVHQRTFKGRRWSLARCGDCRLHFTSPIPTQDDLSSFYAGEYHADLRTSGGTEAAFGSKYQRYADTLGRRLTSGRVVDVGCSTGLLVRTLRDRGYDAEGIELNEQSAAWGRAYYGVPIRTDPLERDSYPPESLNAVLLTDVLEHTQHPREFLRTVRGMLVPGGFVLVTFPDIGSLESRYQHMLSRLLRREWMWSSCHIPLHVWEFTRRTAEGCFVGAGFRVVEFRRSQIPHERAASLALRALGAPLRLLDWAPLGRWLGTQMEFVIQKVGDSSENE